MVHPAISEFATNDRRFRRAVSVLLRWERNGDWLGSAPATRACPHFAGQPGAVSCGPGKRDIRQKGTFIFLALVAERDLRAAAVGVDMRFRAATYNVHKCRGLDRRVAPGRIAEVLQEVDADVVALQEVLSAPAAGGEASRRAGPGRWNRQ